MCNVLTVTLHCSLTWRLAAALNGVDEVLDLGDDCHEVNLLSRAKLMGIGAWNLGNVAVELVEHHKWERSHLWTRFLSSSRCGCAYLRHVCTNKQCQSSAPRCSLSRHNCIFRLHNLSVCVSAACILSPHSRFSMSRWAHMLEMIKQVPLPNPRPSNSNTNMSSHARCSTSTPCAPPTPSIWRLSGGL